MNTGIVLKEYSELSLWQKIKLNYLIPKWFKWIEDTHVKAGIKGASSEKVSYNRLFLVWSVHTAELMSYYNSEVYSDYRVLEKSVDYLVAASEVESFEFSLIADKILRALTEILASHSLLKEA